MYKKIVGLCIAVVVLAGVCSPVNANLTFFNISNNSPVSATLGQYLEVVVSNPGSNQVLFTFMNQQGNPFSSSITDIYFDDGSLLAIATISSVYSGVSFSPLASPGNLPSHNNIDPPFYTSTGFSADSDPPAQPMGINPGESLDILFTLQGTQEYADVMAELDSGALRIGLHVQGLPLGESDAFVNNPPPITPGPPIPAPGAILLGSIGMGFVGWLRRRNTI